MMLKLCRDGVLYAVLLYLFEGMRSDFDITHWPVALRWGMAGTWLFVMVCLVSFYRERAKRDRAREG